MERLSIFESVESWVSVVSLGVECGGGWFKQGSMVVVLGAGCGLRGGCLVAGLGSIVGVNLIVHTSSGECWLLWRVSSECCLIL